MIRIVLETLSGQVMGFDDATTIAIIKEVTYTKEEIDTKLTSVLRFRGTVDYESELPLTGNARGDVWAVRSSSLEYVWISDRSEGTIDDWEQLGPLHDMTPYYTKVQINAMLGTIPPGHNIMELLGMDGTEGKSMKQLHEELVERVEDLEEKVDEHLDDVGTAAIYDFTTHLFTDLNWPTRTQAEIFESIVKGVAKNDAIRIVGTHHSFTALTTYPVTTTFQSFRIDPYTEPAAPALNSLMNAYCYGKAPDGTGLRITMTFKYTDTAGVASNISLVDVQMTKDDRLDRKINEIFRRIGDGDYNHPDETTYQAGKEYFKKNEFGEYVLLVAGTDYTVGDTISGDVYKKLTNNDMSQRIRINEIDIANLKARLKDTLYAYNYDFSTSKFSDPFGEKGEGECKMELVAAALSNKAIRIVALNKPDPLGDQPVNFIFVNAKRTEDRIIGVPLLNITYVAQFYAHLAGDRLGMLTVKYTWREPVGGGDPMDIVLDSVNVIKYEFNYTLVDDDTLKPTTANRGDICVVRKLMNTTDYIYVGYVWDGGEWKLLNKGEIADDVFMNSNIQLLGDYDQVGNIKRSAGTLTCQGWSLTKLVKEIFYKVIDPTLGDAPSVTTTIAGPNQLEVGTSFMASFSSTYAQGKYNRSWDHSSVDDGTAATAWYCTDSIGRVNNAQSGNFTTFTVEDECDYYVTTKADHGDGAFGKDNTGADSTVKRAAGTTGNFVSDHVTAYRNLYVGSISTDDTITEAVIKSLTAIKTGEIDIVVKTSGGDAPLVAGAKKIIVAVPTATTGSTKTACGGQELNGVYLLSAGGTPITADYKAKPNVSVAGAVSGITMKDYKVWVYQPASIHAGEVHLIKIK